MGRRSAELGVSRRRWMLLLVTAGATLSAACSSTSTPSAGDAEKTLRSAAVSDHRSAVAIDALLNTQSGAEASKKVLTSGTSGDARWFALYVYVNSGSDADPLRPLLSDKDASVRLLAASGLVRLGDSSGFPVLIDLLRHTETIPASEPPTPVWIVATETLARMIGDGTLGPPFDANSYQRQVAYDRWTAWYEAHKGKLHLDSATSEWSTG